MFYVMYLLDFEEYIVIPESWLRDAKQMMQKFMRSGLNVSQTHLCYFNKEAAMVLNGIGQLIFNQVYPPNFDLPLSNTYPCDEGIFYCRVATFHG